MSSANVFGHDWGNWIRLGIAVSTSAGLLFVALWLGGRMRVKGWLGAVMVFVGIGGGMALGFLLPWPSYIGRYEHLYWLKTKDRVILAALTQFSTGGRGGHSRYHYLSSFDMATGEALGRTELPVRHYSGPYVEVEGTRGSWAYLPSPEGYVVVDLATATTVASEKELAKKIGPYRRKGFDRARWAVRLLLPDGRTRELPMGKPPKASELVVPMRPSGVFCGTWTRRRRSGRRIAGLLRAFPMYSTSEPCRFQSGTDSVQLYLHRSTAFGEAAYLLSAVKEGGGRKWTLDLSARCGLDARYEVLSVESTAKGLRLLVGAKETIFWFLVAPETGAVIGERALY